MFLMFIKVAIVLVPSYTAVYLTDKMVYVVPTLAAGFFAANVDLVAKKTIRRVDDDVQEDANIEMETDSFDPHFKESESTTE